MKKARTSRAIKSSMT